MNDEHVLRVDCFGSRCTIAVALSASAAGDALAAAGFLLECHRRLSRFLPESELSRLNADERDAVPVSPLMLDFLIAARRAAETSGGLVDPTVLPALRRAGYGGSIEGLDPGDLAEGLAAAPPSRVASPDPAASWREIAIDATASLVHRPPGVEIDSGGIAKGWAADRAAELIAPAATLAVECAGDMRVGGEAGVAREINIGNPFGGNRVGTLWIGEGGVATSGIGKRRWVGADGTTAHHLIDPGTGMPCFSGVVQATALAPTAEQAEMRAKAAVLAGPDRAAEWLPDGGLVVLDDGSVVDHRAGPSAALSAEREACAA